MSELTDLVAELEAELEEARADVEAVKHIVARELFRELDALEAAPTPQTVAPKEGETVGSQAWREMVDALVSVTKSPKRYFPRRTPYRGTPITPQSIRTGDLFDIHTQHGTTITGVLAGRNGIYRPQPGDQYRLVHRAA